MDKKTLKAKLKDFWKKYEPKIILILGLILASVLSFEAGVIKGQKIPQNPIIIEKPAEKSDPAASSSQTSENQNLPPEPKNSENSNPSPDQNCAFVGSKNSNKYHLPSCPYAKRIKPENIVCFSSAEDAAAKGYQPDSNCIK